MRTIGGLPGYFVPAQGGFKSRHYTFVLHFLYLVVGAVRPVMGLRSGLAPTSNMSWRRTCVSIISSLERSCRSWSRPVRVLRLPSQGSRELPLHSTVGLP